MKRNIKKEELYSNSESLEKKVQEFLHESVKVGDHVVLFENCSKKEKTFKVISITEEGFMTVEPPPIQKFKVSDVLRKAYPGNMGANDFDEWYSRCTSCQYSLESILFVLGVFDRHVSIKDNIIAGVQTEYATDNPFVLKSNGERFYYQRDYCWDLKSKQDLIKTIYARQDCGSIVVREHSYESLKRRISNGETTELYEREIVDGKQRLKAIVDFITNEFPDHSGNYWNDLSIHARSRFLSGQWLRYVELPTDATDAEVLKHFLRVNVAGVPQNPAHLDSVQSCLGEM